MRLLLSLLLCAASLASGPTAAAPAPGPTLERNCVLPALEFEDGDAALSRYFTPASKRFALLQKNIRAGFQRACNKGLIAGSNIPELEYVPMRRMWFENIPDGNAPSIMADQLAGGTGWRLLLQHPFVASNGKVSVPTTAEIEEAIHCAVRGATKQEQEESGRCLVD